VNGLHDEIIPVMDEPKRLEWTGEELNAFFERLDKGELTDFDRQHIREIFSMMLWMGEKLEHNELTIKRLQRLFGIKTEKAANLFGNKDKDQDPKGGGSAASGSPPPKNDNSEKKPKGKNGADDYPDAKRIYYPHESLKPGDLCPICEDAKLYHYGTASVLRITGQPPVVATVHEPEQLRCASCGEIFTAQLPDSVGMERADACAKATIATFRYGAGIPFYRMEMLSEMFRVALPDSTQWDMSEDVADACYPVFKALITYAAQGELFFSDDTSMRIIKLKKKLLAEGAERTGIFTSGILASVGARKIALFFSGNKHAGENMAMILKKREEGLALPNLMCDALSRNKPKEVSVNHGNCMDHCRREYVDLVKQFEAECEYFLGKLGNIYRNDSEAKRFELDDDERQWYHWAHSRPIMEELHAWCLSKFENKEVEPNSLLGRAMNYFLNHFPELAKFYQTPGMPIANSPVEQLLKTAVLHRKNSLFYQTVMGALVGDVLMSIIQTAKRARANVLDYLTKLQLYTADVKLNPRAWFPWNYTERVELLQAAQVAT
jgi:transposase